MKLTRIYFGLVTAAVLIMAGLKLAGLSEMGWFAVFSPLTIVTPVGYLIMKAIERGIPR